MARSRASANVAAMRYRWNEKTGMPKRTRKLRQLAALSQGRETAKRHRAEEKGAKY